MKNHNDDVLMVLNPNTQKLNNVKPLFDLCQITSFNEFAETIDKTIRALVLYVRDDVLREEVIDDYVYFLYHVRDMFTELNRCEISLPEKKGAKS